MLHIDFCHVGVRFSVGITGAHLSATVDVRSTQFRAHPFQVARKILAQKLLSSVRTGKLAQTAHAPT